MIEAIEVIDWCLDFGALLVSLLVTKKLLGLTARETLTAVACFGLYGLHEVWESGIVGGDTHRAFEWWVRGMIHTL